MDAGGVELAPVVRHVLVRVRQRPLQPLELQRRERVAARAFRPARDLRRSARLASDWHRSRPRLVSVDQMTLDPVALAAEQRDGLAALVGNLDVVDARAPGELALVRARGQHVARARRRGELDRAAGRHGVEIVAVARVRERAVGEREDEAAVADLVAVQHVGPHRHRELGEARADVRDADAERLRRRVARVHRLGDALGQRPRIGGRHRRVMLTHGAFLPWPRGARPAATCGSGPRRSARRDWRARRAPWRRRSRRPMRAARAGS